MTSQNGLLERAINDEAISEFNHMQELKSLFYVSTAAHFLASNEVDHLLEAAQARNTKEGVTGILLYEDGSILQYLEGPTDGLSKVYAVIKSDPLHYGMVELFYETIKVREFPEFPLAFCSSSKAFISKSKPYNEHLTQWLARTDIPMSKARLLITQLWNRSQRYYLKQSKSNIE